MESISQATGTKAARSSVKGDAKKDWGYIPLDLIEVGLCPLKFKQKKLSEHEKYSSDSERLFEKDKSLEHLIVGEAIDSVRYFPYWDSNRNKQTGSQTIIAHYGLAPADFRIIVGLYNELRELDIAGLLPDHGQLEFTLPEIARMCRMQNGGGKQNTALRSAIFRLSFLTLHSTASWFPELEKHGHRQIKLFTIKFMDRLGKKGTKNHDPIVLQFDASFVDLVRCKKKLKFDRTFFHSLSFAVQRIYLLANRHGWKKKVSPELDADCFACNQLWLSDSDVRLRKELEAQGRRLERRHDRTHQRRGWLVEKLKEAQQQGIIKPCSGKTWNGEFFKTVTVRRNSQPVIRWSNGPILKHKRDDNVEALASDPLWQEVQQITDQDGEKPSPKTYRHWEGQYGRELMAKHIAVIRWLKQTKPDGFKESEVQTYVDRLNKDYGYPDGYQQESQQSLFDVANEGLADLHQESFGTI